MGLPLDGRTALVTGAGRGIGRTIALALAGAGADVALVARTQTELQETEITIRSLGRRAISIPADVAEPSQAKGAVTACAEGLGPPEVLVNAAAIQGPIGRFDTNELGEWIHAVQVGLFGAVYTIHAVLTYMIPARRGKIINISGGGAAGPRPNFSAYASSKAALVRFTETLAEELRDTSIQINAMAPGATRTRMTEEVLGAGARAGARALAEAQEVWQTAGADPKRQAALAVFLASDDSNQFTGRLIHVNDSWEEFRASGAPSGDVYTLRRVNPSNVSLSR